MEFGCFGPCACPILSSGPLTGEFLIDGVVGAAFYRLRWDGRDARGADAGPGIFWITARAGAQTDRMRIVRLR